MESDTCTIDQAPSDEPTVDRTCLSILVVFTTSSTAPHLCRSWTGHQRCNFTRIVMTIVCKSELWCQLGSGSLIGTTLRARRPGVRAPGTTVRVS
jgi:hypothetical protein